MVKARRPTRRIIFEFTISIFTLIVAAFIYILFFEGEESINSKIYIMIKLLIIPFATLVINSLINNGRLDRLLLPIYSYAALFFSFYHIKSSINLATLAAIRCPRSAQHSNNNR